MEPDNSDTHRSHGRHSSDGLQKPPFQRAMPQEIIPRGRPTRAQVRREREQQEQEQALRQQQLHARLSAHSTEHILQSSQAKPSKSSQASQPMQSNQLNSVLDSRPSSQYSSQRARQPVSQSPSRPLSQPLPQFSSRRSLQGPVRHPARDSSPRRTQGRSPRRVKALLGVGAVIVLLCGGFSVYWLFFKAPADYSGPGGPQTIVQVHSGDTALEIADSLAEKDIVASAKGFYQEALKHPNISSVQPGFYALPTRISSQQAATELISNQARVGALIIPEGMQLHSATEVGSHREQKGIYQLIVEASCYGSSKEQQCVSYDALNQAGAGDAAGLGVPTWAIEPVQALPERSRQLEGLIAAGSWNFDPTLQPTEILRYLVTESVKNYEVSGIVQSAANIGFTPYELLTMSSLVEREVATQDFPRAARVIMNRLHTHRRLEFDSTVNYGLTERQIATSDADRAQRTPWNTYAKTGLPASPVCSPSLEAVRAVEQPTPGDWLYFVTVDQHGTTRFTADYQEHLQNVAEADRNGVFNQAQ